MLNNFSFEPTRIQAVLVTGPVCAVGDPGAATEFVLPSNGTRVIPAPPGVDICWRRELVAGEARETPLAGPWAAWSRAYTGPGRFLDAVVMTPSAPDAVVENTPTAACSDYAAEIPEMTHIASIATIRSRCRARFRYGPRMRRSAPGR